MYAYQNVHQISPRPPLQDWAESPKTGASVPAGVATPQGRLRRRDLNTSTVLYSVEP